ncbi:hypothetical protein DDP57_03575 [Helicobacter pylori]|nr:hypothetical protein DDP57_03575 [Helicobacter pylori]
MRKLFIPLLLFSALEANEKNGFFIEAGFETGLLEGTQTQEKRHTTTKNTYATYNYLPTDSVLKRAANLFTDAKSISQLNFSSLSPVKVLYIGGKLTIENFLPYNLSNVKLSFTDAQGNTIDLGVIETIPKHSKIVLPGEAFDSLKEAFIMCIIIRNLIKGSAMLINAVIEKDENGYFAFVPFLKGCVSQGKSYEEALRNIKEAIELYLGDLEADELAFLSKKNSVIAPIEIAFA